MSDQSESTTTVPELGCDALFDARKYCVTCHENGHTYLECPKVNFGDMFSASMGIPNMMTGESAQELRERVTGEIEDLHSSNVEADEPEEGANE